MSGFPRRQVQAFDLDAFEQDGELDGASKIMEMFKRRNNRVLQIFQQSDDDDTPADQSYRLLLTSKSQNDVLCNENEEQQKENEIRTPKSSANSTQPNQTVATPKRPASHMRNLSPVHIVTLRSEELRSSEKVVNPPAASQAESIKSRRRSLFSIIQSKFSSKNDPVCSTPLTGHQRGARKSFFEAEIDNALSPIRSVEMTPKKPTNESNIADEIMNGIEPIKEPQLPAPGAVTVNQPPIKISQVSSLAELDNDLRSQYEIMDKSISRKTYRPVEMIAQTQSSSSTDKEAQDENMDIEAQSISRVQNNRSKRSLSFQNKTDFNSVRIIETPVCSNRQQSLNLNSILSVKLRRCDVSTDAEPSDVVVNSSEQSDAVVVAPVSSSSSSSSEQSDGVVVAPVSEVVVNSSEQSDVVVVAPISATEKNVSIEPVESEFLFPKPKTTRVRPKKSVKTSVKAQEFESVRQPIAEETLEESNNFSSSSRIIQNEMFSSLRSLKRRDEPEEPKSLKINMPKKQKISSVSVLAQSYLNLTNKNNTLNRKDSTNSRKRNLYSEQYDKSFESRSPSNAPSPNQPSSTTSERVSINLPTETMDVDEESVETEESPIPNEEEVVSVTKVKKPRKTDKKPLKKSRSRKKSESSTNSDSIENISLSSNDDDDEGFSSERSPSEKQWGVKYDPYAQGCQRPGLRIRRIARPYWIHNGDAETYGITYGVATKKDAKKLIQSKNPQYAIYDKTKRVPKSKTSSKPQSKKATASKSATDESNSNVETAAPSSTGTKVMNMRSDDSLASLIQSIRDGNVSSAITTPSVCCESFDLANVGNIQFRDCGGGLYFGPYIEDKSDGIIKIIAGGHKPRGKSKNSLLKFFVLHGKVEIIVEGTSVKLTTLGYISINPGHNYEVKNTSDQDVILYFTRYDRP